MNYREALDYVYKKTASGSIYGLERVRELNGLLGKPDESMKIIHVAGTNGKGSVSRMLMSILKNAGYKTGIFNSPFLKSPKEYLCINGRCASEKDYAQEVEKVSLIVEKSMKEKPTEFEFHTCLALDYFKSNKCDFAIMECGLGGETDATNMISAPLLAVITNIGLDHVKILGNTISMIASAKAGIIKQGTLVVAYPSEKEAIDVIEAKCRSNGNMLRIADFSCINDDAEAERRGRETFSYKCFDNISLNLKGCYQKRNAALALEAVICLREHGIQISDRAVRLGLKNVKWPARFEIMMNNPKLIIDGGHNAQCIDALCESLERLDDSEKQNMVIVTGVMADKAVMAIYEKLRKYAGYVIATEPDNPRRLDAEEIVGIWREWGVAAEAVRKPADAVRRAFQVSGGNTILVTGSLYMMGEVRDTIGKELKRNSE